MTDVAPDPHASRGASPDPGPLGTDRAPHVGLDRRLDFVRELDALKGVVRRTRVLSGERYENTAEHSWHLAMMALTLAPEADEPVDVARVVEMVLVHDVVEIDQSDDDRRGLVDDDTFVYDLEGRASKADREEAAAERLYGLLPEDEGARLRAAWEEYESGDTPEGRFARALDRLQPLLLNHEGGGGSWVEHGIRADQVLAVNRGIAASSSLWERATGIVDHGVAEGWLAPAAGGPRPDAPGLPAVLVAPRLRLRWPRLSDAPALLDAYAGDERVTRFMTWSAHPDAASVEEHFLRGAVNRLATGAEVSWVVEHDGVVVGMIGVRPGDHGTEVGYVLAHDAWGAGLMTEAVEAVTAAVFAQTDEHRVFAYVDVDNLASARVLAKAGFVEEGVLRGYLTTPHADTPRDCRFLSRLRSDVPVAR